MVSYSTNPSPITNCSNNPIERESFEEEQATFEADKRSVYKHPLFPLLALVFERCEQATQCSELPNPGGFNTDVQAFLQHQESIHKPLLTNDEEVDSLMIKAIQVLLIHLLELEKVQELCRDFCSRYITCLKSKMQSENLLKADYNRNHTESNSSHSSGDSASPSGYSPLSYQGLSGILPQTSSSTSSVLSCVKNANRASRNSIPALHPIIITPPIGDGSSRVAHIQISAHQSAMLRSNNVSLFPESPASAASEEESEDAGSNLRKKQKRGVLPKHATSVMRSWLFMHLEHPYPTEDEKRTIAEETNLTLLQVNNWFINARRRILQPMLEATKKAGGSESIPMIPTDESEDSEVGSADDAQMLLMIRRGAIAKHGGTD